MGGWQKQILDHSLAAGDASEKDEENTERERGGQEAREGKRRRQTEKQEATKRKTVE